MPHSKSTTFSYTILNFMIYLQTNIDKEIHFPKNLKLTNLNQDKAIIIHKYFNPVFFYSGSDGQLFFNYRKHKCMKYNIIFSLSSFYFSKYNFFQFLKFWRLEDHAAGDNVLSSLSVSTDSSIRMVILYYCD